MRFKPSSKTTVSYGPGPFELSFPSTQRMPFVFNSPHSGRHYPERLLRLSRLKADDLRRSEDCFVDLLFESAPLFGAPLLKATYPRVYVDLNREPYELDPLMFSDSLPPYANRDSDRVYAGFGTIPRVVALDMEIYRRKLLFSKEQSRIESIHKPYHRRLKDMLEASQARFGWGALIDCHSMPSNRSVSMLSLGRFISRRTEQEDLPKTNPDIVLGDRYGRSCSPALTDKIEETLVRLGYTVARNNPYAGGYCTQQYGKPQNGMHAIQIEINRRLYMDEYNLRPKMPAFSKLKDDMTEMIRALSRLDLGLVRPVAAE